MPWLESLDWNYPGVLPGANNGIPPFLLWTSETTFSLFWLTPALEGATWATDYARQEFSVASDVIEEVGPPVRLGDSMTSNGYVSNGRLGQDGAFFLETTEIGGS